jgi:predicted phage replisome organizer
MITWLKLDVNILKDEKIELIRTLPAGDSLFILWIGLLCIAMKKETDCLYIAKDVPYNAQGLSELLRLDIETVNLGLQTFVTFEMITILKDGGIFINHLQEHQALDKLSTKKQLNAERQRRYRARQLNVTRYGVTNNATDLDLDLDLEEDTKVSGKKPDIVPYSKIVGYLNEKAGARYRHTTKSTQGFMTAEIARCSLTGTRNHSHGRHKTFFYWRRECR